ncbi:MAG TPA: hypothetical protein VN612_14490 [Acidobacteriaceae bacterium]|nr:hypothetical protein [Acidobacteriaceae bacterium]
MNLRKILPALLVAGLFHAATALAQANATATRTLELSAFGAVSGVYTGFHGGKNFGVVAGADLGLPVWRGVRPQLEVRGLYPADHGVIDSQKSLLGGARFDFLLNHRLRPYADFLAGRGLMRYGINGYQFGNSIYIQTVTPVYSPGAGFDYDLSQHLSVKVDAQLQHWGGAPTQSGNVWSKVGTVGIVYRFTFGPRNLP